MARCYGQQSFPVFKTSRWIFTRAEINNAPSVGHSLFPLTSAGEYYIRKLCINHILRYHFVKSNPQVLLRAAVYAHRFYMVYPFQIYCTLKLCAVCIFEANKNEFATLPVEEIYSLICSVNSCSVNLTREIHDDLKRYETTLLTIFVSDTYIKTPSLPFHPDPMYRETDLAFYNTCVYLCICSTSLTTLCLEQGIDILFYACVCLVSHLTGYPLADSENGGPWYTSTRLGVSARKVENISGFLKSLFEKDFPQILQLVSQMPFGKKLHEIMIQTQAEKLVRPVDCKLYDEPLDRNNQVNATFLYNLGLRQN